MGVQPLSIGSHALTEGFDVGDALLFHHADDSLIFRGLFLHIADDESQSVLYFIDFLFEFVDFLV